MIDGTLGWKATGFSRILNSIVGSGDKPGIDETEDISKMNRETGARALQTVRVWLWTYSR
jgi:hypothetical protein